MSEVPGASAPIPVDPLTPIYKLDLSMRLYNALCRNNVETLGAIVELTEHDVLVMRNVGQGALDELKAKLATYGLSLRPPEPETPRYSPYAPPPELEDAAWIGRQLDKISEDSRAQPTTGLFGRKLKDIPLVERRRFAWRMYRWTMGYTDKWPNMTKEGAAFEAYPLPGSWQAQLAGLNRLAHEELGE